ncbi:MAG TPA: M23 family metallopeptidase [Novosphingobium sp.]|nr:M23 family metallopeptidase [Novosphingobium sp.]
MFKLREQMESGTGGPATGAAALSYAQLLVAPAVPVSSAFEIWRQRARAKVHSLDVATDLAEDIGSARWFRGLGIMLILTSVALSFWPDYSSLEAAPPLRLDRAARDQFRSQTIQPLGLGGDSGSHMGATARVHPLASAPERPTLQMVATLGQGDSFGRMLERAGVGPGDAARAAGLIGESVPLGEIAPGTRFDLTLGKRIAPGQPRALHSLAFRARFDLDLAIARSGGGLVLQRKPIAVDSTPLRIRGLVGASLYRSARAAGVPIGAIQQYLQTLDAHLSLDTDIQPTDSFDIVVEYKRVASGEAQLGQLLFAGLERGGKPQTQLLRWGTEGQFYEASGIGEQRSGLIMPVVGHITSGYGARRHPILGYTRMHAGVDFGAPWGSPIYAVANAVVSFAGRHGGHGNYVRLEHGGGLGTGYGHMSRIAVAPGSHVRAGQVIGYVGSTGLSTGPHLHYELYQNGKTVNPLTVRFTIKSQVDGKELALFKAKLAQLKAIKPGAALGSLASKQAVAIRLPE